MPRRSDLAVPPLDRIQQRIFVLRGVRVMLDVDLAALYGVPTKRLNEQVKRNARRFPEDFMFRLTRDETTAMWRSRSQIATLNRGQNIKHLPLAFTEHGAVQAANVLNSETAIEMGVQVVRAFNLLRRMFADHRALASKLAELERRIGGHDGQLAAVVEAIRRLAVGEMARSRRKIGFHQGNR
jgi:hypothetical protein